MITIAGLGPGDLSRVPAAVLDLLLDPSQKVVARTSRHPAAKELARKRDVAFCDDLYETMPSFDLVYEAIVDRVVEAAASGPVVYAVPGSPTIGEFSVRLLVSSGADVSLVPAESFVDAILDEVGYDPMDRGLQILNAHQLADPLILDKPTIIGQLDTPEVLAETGAAVDRVTPEECRVTLLASLGSADARVVVTGPAAIDPALAGDRTSMFIDTEPGGLVGAVRAMRILREECPWDREQTHATLAKYLVEETYELIDAIVALEADPTDLVAYAAVEDELGDVLLSVLFHSAIARQAGVFDIDDVAEVLRQKLVRRHPHVFGDIEVGSAAEVKSNWDEIKAAERPDDRQGSILDGIPSNMPAMQRASKVQNRAAKVGFDWQRAPEVIPKVREELEELESAIAHDGQVQSELGDLLFSMVNLARHLGIDPELSLVGATGRFERRLRDMESEGPLHGLTLAELDERWERAKGAE